MFTMINPNILKQSPGEKPYYWLRDVANGFDIFYWQDASGQARRFQIWGEDRLWEWNAGKNWRFGLSDPQNGSFKHLQSPTYRYAQQTYLQPLRRLQGSISESLSDSSLKPILLIMLQEIEKLLDTNGV